MSSEFTLRQLEYFVAVLESGSMTEAARQSRISQAAASAAIAQLERTLGVDLFVRTRARRLKPTAAGESLGLRARRILADAAELPQLARAEVDELSGRVRLGCMVAISPRLLPLLATEVARRHPAIELEATEGAAEQLQRDTANGGLDVAFVFSLQTLPDVDVQPICPARAHVLLPVDHQLAAAASLHFADLAGQDAVLLDVPPSAERVLTMFHTAGVEPRVRWRSTLAETVREMVGHGLGYSIVNVWPGMDASFRASGVVSVPIADDVPQNAVVATTAAGVRTPRRVQAVIEAARAVTTAEHAGA